VSVSVTVALVATVTSLSVVATENRPVSAESVGQPPAVQPPAVPGSGTAYLGAFVDPDGTALSTDDPTGGDASLQPELGALPDFDQQAGQPSIVSTFQNWAEPVDAADLEGVAAAGSIPMVTWNCGDTDANVAAGSDDAMVRAEALGLAATDVPILFRWFPDPNLTGAPAAASCLGAAGASGYIAAYQHIHSLFEAAGATNVAFVWSVDTSSPADSNFASYYPGGDVVDWIAADGGTTPGDESQPSAFTAEFGPWYAAFSTAGKPMMVSSAGADAGSQPAYLGQVASALSGPYPQIKALIYFDAPQLASGDQYQLGPAGLASLQHLAESPLFEPTRSPTDTTVSPSQTSIPIGTTVTLKASVDARDNGGSVSFLDDGSPIAGCVSMPITAPLRCHTSGLGAGPQGITAEYGGDATFSPSTSAEVTVAVTPLVTATPSSGVSAMSAPSVRLSTKRPAPPPPSLPSISSEPPAPLGAPPVPGPGQAYLGAFVDPTGQAMSASNPTGGVLTMPVELTNASSFNAGLARPSSLMPIYLNWTNTILVTQLDRIWAQGAIPMITWSCGDSDWNVATGKDDALISAVAQKLAAAHMPILLRWFPDPNDRQSASAQKCLVNVPNSPGPAAAYRAAYQHIHDLFAAAGATNVSFAWSVDTTGGQGPQSWSTYYPGSASVDWIGADVAYSSPNGSSDPFSDAVQQWYDQYAASGKPLIVSSLAVIPGTQGPYLQHVAKDLPGLFPQIKGIVDFDAPDRVNSVHYSLTSQGLQAFDALSAQAFFSLSRQQAAVSAMATPDAVAASEVVKITASIAPTDFGGGLDFSDNGATIPGCGAVPVLLASSCDTSSLSPGQHSITVTYGGDAEFAPAAAAPVSVSVSPIAGASGPPSIPGPGSAYLGAYVRPQPLKGPTYSTTSLDQELHLLPGFNASLPRPLSVVHIYQAWSTPTPDEQIQQVRAAGAIPMIDWACGDTDANIISGADDALISGFAHQLAALNAPVFLRWYYEPNFPGGSNYAACISSLGPQGYVDAFRHIHDLFVAAGASNVAFIWTIGASGTDHDWIDYYPGSAYVDWITADGYARTSTPSPGVFSQRFAQWYQTFAGFGKPLMITETAAFTGAQQDYLNEIRTAVPSQFPLLKGIIYFDALGNLPGYPLVGGGMQAFKSLASDPFFQPSRASTGTGVEATPANAVTGQEVTLTANVQATDNGGTVSFYDRGQPINGCQSLALDVSSSCTSTGLAVGANTITAVYSGDAYNVGSNGGAAGPTITPLTFPVVAGFAGVPDLALVGALSFGPQVNGVPALSSLSRSASSNGPGGGDSDPFELLEGAFRGKYGFGTDALIIGSGLMLLGGAYIAVTWMQDQRRRRKAPAGGPVDLGSNMSGDAT
jgi:beta-mannanase